MPQECLDIWVSSLLAILALGLIFSSFIFYGRFRIATHRSLFRCQKCGNCCRLRFISVTCMEADALRKLGFNDFLEKDKNGNTVIRRVNGRCYFLEENSCRVYNNRPEVCREFPFGKFLGLAYCRNANWCPAVEELEKG